MTRPPTDPLPDSTLAFRRDPYRFISRRCARFDSDVFQTRLMLEPAVCMIGAEAAELFYDTSRFRREGAMPGRLKRVLFGKGGVQSLDGSAHRHRKALLLSLMSPESLDRLDALVRDGLRARVPRWSRAENVELCAELDGTVAEAVAIWCGVPVEGEDMAKRAAQMTRLFARAASVGPPYWRAFLDRRQLDRWTENLVRQTRAGRIDPPQGSALRVIAEWRDAEGEPLAEKVAGVELLNVLRPTTAVAVYMTFVAHALHVHRMRPMSDDEIQRFVQEVRRTYPFFPALAAQTRQAFDWRGWHFPEGRRVLLDLYGTNRDPRLWAEPEAFRPERFEGREPTPFDLIPQGGGAHRSGHRCPGEWITIRLMTVATRFLISEVAYEVPDQDLSLDYAALPALPRHRMRITKVRSTT